MSNSEYERATERGRDFILALVSGLEAGQTDEVRLIIDPANCVSTRPVNGICMVGLLEAPAVVVQLRTRPRETSTEKRKRGYASLPDGSLDDSTATVSISGREVCSRHEIKTDSPSDSCSNSKVLLPSRGIGRKITVYLRTTLEAQCRIGKTNEFTCNPQGKRRKHSAGNWQRYQPLRRLWTL